MNLDIMGKDPMKAKNEEIVPNYDQDQVDIQIKLIIDRYISTNKLSQAIVENLVIAKSKK